MLEPAEIRPTGTRPSAALGSRLLTLARADAQCGRDRDCVERVAAAGEVAWQCDEPAIAIGGAAILGLLELGLGNIGRAELQLAGCALLVAGRALADADELSFGADHVEALIALGRYERAHAASARAQRGAFAGRPRRHASAARARALVAGGDAFETAFQSALELYALLDDDFEFARTRLLLGERLRRARRLSDARAHLSEAVGSFGRIGALPWVGRARRELAAATPTARRRHPDTLDQLSTREFEVATVLAEGATVQEAAARLFVSNKTIESHLQHAYRKLGVHNRAQLVNALRRV